MLIEIVGLNAHYGRVQALKHIDLSIDARELVALVGANGAGKTTLLRTISGVQPSSGGTIRFAGLDVTHAAPSRRVKLGIVQVPEGRQVFGPLSVDDNLRLGAYTRVDNSEEDLTKVYAMFPALLERRNQAAGTLSGGEQQMLAMGRALMARPRLLLLDEPSMGLAPLLVAKIFDAIAALKEQGATIFLVEQNARAALGIADRGYVIETGQIVLSDTGRALMNNEGVKQAYLGL